MANWGLKFTKSGYPVTTTDPREILMSSKYMMFKYHNEYTATVTFNPGDKTKTTSIAHNLGYVPAFMAYGVRSDDSANFIIPSIPYATSEFDWGEAWADQNNIYFKVTIFDQYVGAGWNEIKQNMNTTYNTFSGDNSYAMVGNASGSGASFGVQYASVPILKDQSIVSATLDFLASDTGSGTEDIKMDIYGIDVDSLSDFGSDMGQTRTTATHKQTQSSLNDGQHFGITVTNELSEIIARSGWSSGNNLGFYVNDDGTSSSGNNYVATYPDNQLILSILKTGTLTVNFRVIVFKDKIAT